MFKVNNKGIRTMPLAFSGVFIWRGSGFSIVKFEHVSHFALVFLLLTLSK